MIPMGKKDHDDERRHDPLAHLGKDARKRLEKLGEDWEKEPGGFLLEKLNAPDLRLLLEYSKPLHDLIRQIAATAPGQTVPSAAAQDALESARDEAEAAQSEAEDQCRALQVQLAANQRDAAALRQQLAEAQQRSRAVEQELRSAQRQLASLEQELARQRQQQGAQPPALALLRQDSTLAQRLDLADLPADASAALIRVVAVLAQMNSIERLWDALKENCERDRRPASAEETALLQTALDWHNHNWSRRPYTLHRPRSGDSFDYGKEQRATASPSGDTLNAVWLPGIVAGSGHVQKKALVATR